MVYIGTAGYSYKDWIGPFYPEGTKSSQMLQYYCQHFNFVEINSSFYHMPSLKLFNSICTNTPDKFKTVVKLFGGFTHERNMDIESAEKFRFAISPLMESDKLISVLAQFPYSFHYNEANVGYLKRLKEWFKDVEISVEFRNQEWINRTVVSFLKKEKLGFVCVDEPNINGLVKKVIAITSNVTYLRFHGRNSDKWYDGEGSQRYNYLYTREELLQWVRGIKELERNSGITVVSFNNHPLGKAVENAKALSAFLNNL